MDILGEFQIGQINTKQKLTIEDFTILLNSTIEGLLIFDEKRKCIYANKVALKMLGHTPSSVYDKSPLDFIAPQSHKTVQDALKIPDKDPYEAFMKRGDGTLFPAVLRGKDISLAGETVRISAILDNSILQESKHKIFKLAYYDTLTGLPNRQKLNEDIQTETYTACAILNIDQFKELNDFFGLFIGDSILKQIGKWFLRHGVQAYRIGGDEFAVLYKEDAPCQDIQSNVAALLTSIEEKTFKIQKEVFTIRMTAGVAFGTDRLLTRADIALHKAKEQKLSLVLYEEQDNIEKKFHKNIAMTATIRDALLHNRVVCFYQPILDFKTAAIVKYETLVRIIDKQGNTIPPLEFLSIAKKTKLYYTITETVVRQACTLFAKRKERFSVNLSKSDIKNHDLIEKIFDIIAKTGTASRIIFEILEYEEIENYAEVAKFVQKSKALGIRIAIDDFGTGYSNFENILKLNIDYIKIDGSLIQGIAKHERHDIIVQTIVEFAKKVGAKTIAEFVSDETIFEVAKNYDIDYAQGYFIGKPSPKLLDEITASGQ
jgi:diguanylate cyclase (GGDEF)-like protein/PAS domain S-box-containing protein